MKTNDEIITDTRFRRAILLGEYTRAVCLFLRIRFPGVEHIESLPKEERLNAKECVIGEIIKRQQIAEEMGREMV